MDESRPASSTRLNRLLQTGLTAQILIAFAAGAIVGALWPSFGASLQILATIFVRLVMVIIAPLLFSTLLVGIAGQGELRRLGSMAVQAFAYFMALTGFALAGGFALGMILEPGAGFSALSGAASESTVPPAESFWVRLFPSSIIDAMARGDVLQIVLFSILFATAVSLSGERGRPILELGRSLSDVMFRFTNLVMRTAPVGVFGAAAAMVGKHGLQVGESFLKLVLAVYLGLAVMLAILFPALALAFRIPLGDLFRAIREPFAIAFATTSSSAALPRAMENMEAMGVPRRVTAFVLPTALSFNLSGSHLFVGVAVLFILQAFGIALSLGQTMTLFGTMFVASKGIANVPRASLVVIAAGLGSQGVPPEVVGAGVGILLGIDPILDMPRTAVNTTGNCVGAALVARWQGHSPPSPHSGALGR